MKAICPTTRRARLVQLADAARFARGAAPQFFRGIQNERKRPVGPAPFVPHPQKWPDKGLHAAWLGHSSVLLKIDGFTILTDPVLGNRCGVRVGPMTVGLKRMVAPALLWPQLPHIDLILLSHAHFDHFDLPTLRRLERSGTAVVTASNTSDLLRVRRYASVRELGWGERSRVGPLSILGFEVRHWGARLRSDTHRGYNGYLLETGRHRVVFGGDTAYTDSFRVARSSRPVDLAIMPIGAYNPWIHAHCNPEQAWREPFFEPVERFMEAAGSRPERVVTTRIGQEWSQD